MYPLSKNSARFFQAKLVEGIGCVIAILASGQPADVRFHEARKKLKELRAILRLIRVGVGETEYASRNQALRDVARGLSTLRDAHVIGETLHAALARNRRLPASSRAAIEGYVGAYQRRMVARETARRDVTGEALRRLRAIQARVRRAPVASLSPEIVEKGLRRTYRRCRKLGAESCRLRSDEAFHEWRKSVKHLRHQVELFAETSLTARRLRRLGDFLGHDHDCAVLAGILARSSVMSREPGARRIAAGLRARQGELRRQAGALARLLFGHSPREFSRRLR